MHKINKKFSGVANIKLIPNCNSNAPEIIELRDPGHLLSVLYYLQQDPEVAFQSLMDLTAVDYLDYGKPTLDREIQNPPTGQSMLYRFSIIYNLLSLAYNTRIIVKLFLADLPTLLVPSCTKIWGNAAWYEREVFELFGIRFSPDSKLKKLLLAENLVDYPLRKDFSLPVKFQGSFDGASQKIRYANLDMSNQYHEIPKVLASE